MFFGTTWVILMTSLLSTGGNDLLDYLPTANYWKTKHVAVTVDAMTEQLRVLPPADISQLLEDLGSPEPAVRDKASGRIRATGLAALSALKDATKNGGPEIAAKARVLIDEIQAADKAASVRRLMAIRALGELKDPKALPILQMQAQSQELFIADYANAAIASIKGTAYSRPGATVEELKSDPLILPANCGIVAQVNFGSAPPKALTAENFPKVPGQDPVAMLDKIAAFVLPIAEQTGNIRLQGITLGVSSKVGNDAGFAVIIARGLYDPKAVAHVLKAEAEASEQMDKGINVLKLGESKPQFVLPSGSRFIFCPAANEQENPAPAVVSAIAASASPLKGNKEISALMASIDTSLPLWGVAKVSDSYRALDLLQPFDTITLQGRLKDGDLPFQFSAVGPKPDRVKQSVQQIQGEIKEASAALNQNGPMAMMTAPVRTFLDHLQVSADGGKASLDGTLPNPRKLPLGLPLLFGGGPMTQEPATAQPVPQH
jgi:hypothetical protein